MQSARRLITLFGLSAIFVLVVVGAFVLADYVTKSEIAQQIVSQFGYLGVIALAIIAGLNVLVPVPAATFTPVFLAAGLWLPFIILTLTLGTLIADLIGYWFGSWSREYVDAHYPRTMTFLQGLNERHARYVLPTVFLYSAIVPLPNETIVIPLALLGFRFEQLLPALFLGNIVNQTFLAYGIANIFTYLF